MFVKDYPCYAEIPEDYLLPLQQRGQGLFFSPQWFALLEKHILQKGDRLRYLCFLDERRQIEALLPLISPQERPRHYQSFANFYSLDFGPLLARPIPQSSKSFKKIADYFSQNRSDWDVINLYPISGDSLAMVRLEESFREQKFHICQEFFHYNWIYLNQDMTFESYLSEKAKKIRDIDRLERKLRKQHSCTLKIIRDADGSLENYIKDYNRVYDNSWKDSENYPDFIPDLIRLCAGQGSLRLGILYVDDIPVATQFNIHHGTTTLIYKLCYDEAYKSKSVGAILSKTLMQMAFDEDRATIIDYGCGNDGYKRDWMSHRLKKKSLKVYNNTLAGKKAYLRALAGKIRNLLRQDGF